MSHELDVSEAFERSHVSSESVISKTKKCSHAAGTSTKEKLSRNTKTENIDKGRNRFLNRVLQVSKFARRNV